MRMNKLNELKNCVAPLEIEEEFYYLQHIGVSPDIMIHFEKLRVLDLEHECHKMHKDLDQYKREIMYRRRNMMNYAAN